MVYMYFVLEVNVYGLTSVSTEFEIRLELPQPQATLT